MKKNQFNTDFDKITCEGENMLLLELLLGAEKSWHYYIFFFLSLFCLDSTQEYHAAMKTTSGVIL